MGGLLGSKSLPPGFRFHPTDEELFMYYLKRKVSGKSLNPEMIAELDVYQFAPWELPLKSSLKTRDLNWYFFCPRAKKYPNGGRANRATVHGYWKSTGNDRTMIYNTRPVGKIKTLIFYRGKPPKGERTDWVMHEYKMEDKGLAEKGVPQDSYVICKIYEKSGLGPKNGEHYGARFVEEEWDSDDDENLQPVANHTNPDILATFVDTPLNAASVIAPNITNTSVFSDCDFTSSGAAIAPAEDLNDDEIERLLACFTEDNDDDSSIFNGLGDFGNPPRQNYPDWGDHIEMDDLF